MIQTIFYKIIGCCKMEALLKHNTSQTVNSSDQFLKYGCHKPLLVTRPRVGNVSGVTVIAYSIVRYIAVRNLVINIIDAETWVRKLKKNALV